MKIPKHLFIFAKAWNKKNKKSVKQIINDCVRNLNIPT